MSANVTKPLGLTDWFTELSPVEKRTFWAAFGGFALDGMDILLYSFVIPHADCAVVDEPVRRGIDRNGGATGLGRLAAGPAAFLQTGSAGCGRCR